jgi:hypothetical protein
MALRYNTIASFQFTPSPESNEVCSDISVSSVAFQDAGSDSLLTSSGWGSRDTQLGSSSQMPVEGALCYPPVQIPSNTNSKRENNDKPFIQGDSVVLSDSVEGSLDPDIGFDNSTVVNETALHEHHLSSRDSIGTWPMDNFNMVNWKFVAMALPVLKQVLPKYAQGAFSVGSEAVFKPDGSKTCLKFNETNNKQLCCGCYQMDWYYGYGDIPPYDNCDACATADLVCTWPDGYKRGSDFDSARFCSILGLTSKRGTITSDNDDTDGDESLRLQERDYDSNNPKATISKKTVSVCDAKFSVGVDGRYPAFPKLADRPWDGIENGRWDPISKYWGNTSELCSDWSVDAIFPHDNRSTPRGMKRARYESKSIFFSQIASKTNLVYSGACL